MRVDVYCDEGGGWRWRLRATNGRIVADCAEAYSSKRKLVDALWRIRWWSESDGMATAFRRAIEETVGCHVPERLGRKRPASEVAW